MTAPALNAAQLDILREAAEILLFVEQPLVASQVEEVLQAHEQKAQPATSGRSA